MVLVFVSAKILRLLGKMDVVLTSFSRFAPPRNHNKIEKIMPWKKKQTNETIKHSSWEHSGTNRPNKIIADLLSTSMPQCWGKKYRQKLLM